MILVVIPTVIGIRRGSIPMAAISRWSLPLAGVTVFLAFGLQAIEKFLDPVPNLVISIIFGLAWVTAGVQTTLTRRNLTRSDEPVDRLAKSLAYMFLVFGLIWIALSVYQYVR